jgi:phage FluMu protein Com
MSTPTLPDGAGSTMRLVRCKSPACEQVLARIGDRGDVYPQVPGAYVDHLGRLCVSCPQCKTRNRLPSVRKALR